MSGVKINIGGFNTIFKTMRIWRAIDGTPVKTNQAHYMGEFEAAEYWVDESVMDSRVAQYPQNTFSHFKSRMSFGYVCYVIEFETESGIIREYSVTLPSSFFAERLHCRDIANPFIHGDTSFGIYYPDTALEYMPPEDQVRQLMRNNISGSYSNYGQQSRRFYQWYDSNLFIGGDLYLYAYQQYRYGPSNALYNLDRTLQALPEDTYNPQYDIIVKDVRWRLHVLTYGEAASFGRISGNVSGYNFPYQSAQSYSMHIAYSSSGYAYYQYSTNSNGDYTFSTTTSSSTVYCIPALTMRYAGPAA